MHQCAVLQPGFRGSNTLQQQATAPGAIQGQTCRGKTSNSTLSCHAMTTTDAHLQAQMAQPYCRWHSSKAAAESAAPVHSCITSGRRLHSGQFLQTAGKGGSTRDMMQAIARGNCSKRIPAHSRKLAVVCCIVAVAPLYAQSRCKPEATPAAQAAVLTCRAASSCGTGSAAGAGVPPIRPLCWTAHPSLRAGVEARR